MHYIRYPKYNKDIPIFLEEQILSIGSILICIYDCNDMYWLMFFEININILALMQNKIAMMQYIGTSAEQNSKILQNSKTSAEKK